MHHRRYLTLKIHATADNGEEGLSAALKGVRADVEGTDLPASFPSRSDLISAGYSAVEDLEEATESELVKRGLRKTATAAVLAALAALE